MKARAVGLTAAAVAMVWAATSCTLPVGDLGGGSSEAYGINDHGIVVGSSEIPGSTAAHPLYHGFMRQADQTIVDLAPLPGDSVSVAIKVNNAGTAVGWSIGASGHSVVTWDAAGQVTDLGFDGSPFDMNEAGVIVGRNLKVAADTRDHAFVYDPAVGHAVALPELPGVSVSYAWGINDAGQAVGTMGVSGGVAVRWDLGTGTITDLTPFGVAYANDLNDAGAIVGSGGAGGALVLWPGAPSATSLGFPGTGFAINEGGTIVGRAMSSTDQAYRWTASTGPVELGVSGQQSAAMAINESGGIVGFVGTMSLPMAGGSARASYLFPESS